MQSSYIELKAKKSHYGVDGTGRDTYINFNNGGNFRGFVQHGKGKFEIGSFPSQRNNRIRSNIVQGKPLHYIGDGSGRDCYIITNEGGISKPGNRFNYLKYLRAPIQRNLTRNNDFIRNNDNRGRSTAQSFYQRNLDKRLSTPKNFQDPYKEMRSTFASSMRSSSRSK